MTKLLFIVLTFFITTSAVAQKRKPPQIIKSAPKKVQTPPPLGEEVEPTEIATETPAPVVRSQNAKKDYSRFVWQPDGGQFVIVPEVGYSLNKVNYTAKASQSGSTSGINYVISSTSKSEGDGSAPNFALGLGYGFSDFFALGVKVSYADRKSKYKSTSTTTTTINSGTPTITTSASEGETNYSGLNNPTLYFLFRHRFNSIGIHYGLNTSISPGDSEYDYKASKGNNYSGGFSATPYFSIYYGKDTLLGTLVQYTFNGERKSKTTSTSGVTTETTGTGGNGIAAALFAEFASVSIRPLVIIGYTIAEKSKSKNNSTNTETESEGGSSVNANLRLHLDLAPSITLIPDISYSQYFLKQPSTASAAETDAKFESYGVNFSLRVAL